MKSNPLSASYTIGGCINVDIRTCSLSENPTSPVPLVFSSRRTSSPLLGVETFKLFISVSNTLNGNDYLNQQFLNFYATHPLLVSIINKTNKSKKSVTPVRLPKCVVAIHELKNRKKTNLNLM